MQATDVLHFWFEALTDQQHVLIDPALVPTQEPVASGQDQSLAAPAHAFAHLPYVHSESLMIHQQAVRLFTQPGLEDNLDCEMQRISTPVDHRALWPLSAPQPHAGARLQRAGERFLERIRLVLLARAPASL